MSNWLREGDIVVVDRGFRDSVEFLNDLGIKTEMPVFLKRGQKQHTVSVFRCSTEYDFANLS
jgi:3-deoxy-D-arabino-heptulosonate 7-phosphate (DAHP) synthase